MEYGHVLRYCHLVGGIVERAEIRVVGAPVDVAELLPREFKVCSNLDKRQDLALKPDDPLARPDA